MGKTIGILGGMGPLATADLFRKITLLTDAAATTSTSASISIPTLAFQTARQRFCPAGRILCRKWPRLCARWSAAARTALSCRATPRIISFPACRP